MTAEHIELLPQSLSKSALQRSNNPYSLLNFCVLITYFLGLFLGIIGTLLVEKSINSTEQEQSQTAKRLVTCQDTLKNRLSCPEKDQELEKVRANAKQEQSQTAKLLTTCQDTLSKANFDHEATMTAKLQEEKDACETVKGTLKTCEANNKALKEEHGRANLCPNTSKPTDVEAKCENSHWTYYNETNSCYFYQDLSYNDEGELNTYLRETAESNCVRKKSHLVSIHSGNEYYFVANLILSDVKAANSKAQPSNACSGSKFYAWCGLQWVNQVHKWTDGTPYDYSLFRPSPDDATVFHAIYLMCNDVSNVNTTNLFYYFTNFHQVHGRYVCKKPAND